MTRSKKAKRMRSILLKGFGFTEIAEAVDSECNELASRCDLLKGFGFTEIAEAVDSECNELASRCDLLKGFG
jgi:hypothetical protein